MPRQSRINAPGALHHLIFRGIERRKIFMDDADRERFVGRLGTLVRESGASCFAWALLPNHGHVLIRSGGVPVTRVMRRLLTGHAVSFNTRHNRHGHLFQSRYTSILCQEEPYLLELVRYIHLNPLRAKVVRGIEGLDEYGYSGHSALMGRVERPWQDTGYVLGMFGETEEEARGRYREFVEGGMRGGRKPELMGGGLVRSAGGWSEVRKMRKEGAAPASDERILGDGDFVERVLREEELSRRTRLQREGWTIERVATRAAELCNVELSAINGGSKAVAASRARSLCSYWAVKELGMSAAEVARVLGLSRQTAGLAARRGEELVLMEGFRLTESRYVDIPATSRALPRGRVRR